jgi:hypothetical protein
MTRRARGPAGPGLPAAAPGVTAPPLDCPTSITSELEEVPDRLPDAGGHPGVLQRAVPNGYTPGRHDTPAVDVARPSRPPPPTARRLTIRCSARRRSPPRFRRRADRGVRTRVTPPPIVIPGREDPVVASTTGWMGGPLGRWARVGATWWSPLRVIVAISALAYALGYVLDLSCRSEGWRAPGSLRAPVLHRHRPAVLAARLRRRAHPLPAGHAGRPAPGVPGAHRRLHAGRGADHVGLLSVSSPPTAGRRVLRRQRRAAVRRVPRDGRATALTVRRRPWDAADGGARADDDPRRDHQLGPAPTRLHRLALLPGRGATRSPQASCWASQWPRSSIRCCCSAASWCWRCGLDGGDRRSCCRGNRGVVACRQHSDRSRQQRGLVLLLPVQPDARRGLRLDLVRADARWGCHRFRPTG